MSQAFPRPFRMFATVAAGALAASAAPAIFEALSSPEVPAMWWAARALGLLAYVALWLSMLFGVMLSSKGAGGLLDRAVLGQLHGRWALAALIATTLHALVVLADPRSGLTLLSLLLPSGRLGTAVALGSLALLGMALIAVSTALSRRLPRWLWRAVHALAFGTLLLALAHGLSAGNDRGVPLIRGLYLSTAALLVAVVVQRLLLAARAPRSDDGS